VLVGTARVLYRHGDDIAGVAMVATGCVAALGILVEAGGPAGRGLADAFAVVVGRMRLAVPVALVAAGGSLIWWRRPGPWDRVEVDDDERPRRRSTDAPEPPSDVAGIVVGCALVATASAGLLHVNAGAPQSASADELRHAGGWFGAAVGGPLFTLLSTWGTALVLIAVALLGVVVLTRTPIRVAADRTAAGVRPFARAVAQPIASFFAVPEPDLDDDGSAFYDQDRDRTDPGLGGDDLFRRRRGRGRTADGPIDPHDPDRDRDDTLEEHLDPAALAAAQVAGRRKSRKATEVVEEAAAAMAEPEQLEIELPPAARASSWKLPPVTLLERTGAQQIDKRAVEETGRTLEKALAEHGVETRLVGTVVGPTVSRYELELGPGVKVNRVTSLHKDIAYAMATPDVRILAPIPGKQAIGIEVPNVRRQIVALGDILVSQEARQAKHPLEVAVGRDINGRSVLMNLAAMPHILIAGATGAGKSSCLNSLLSSVLVRSTPDQVRMILIDPKRVEMGQYNSLPHLLTQVVTSPKKAANALAWAVKEMERRYDLLAEVGFRDINGYNSAVGRGDLPPETNAAGETIREFPHMPYILVVIDELADLMMVAARDVEESICRLAQMARAVGIHLVIATQRPSVNVITGLIKANVPARLAFAVSSITDSRVILDQGGAERLIGKGDMLLLEGGSSVARRLQGAWVTEDEVRKIAGVWKRQAPDVAFDQSVQGSEEGAPGGSGGGGGRSGGGDDDDDDLVNQAMELIVRSQLGSTSMLQRKLRVGFARAGRLMDLLEQRGVVGPSEGSKARDVLMTVEELEESQGGGGDGGGAE
jgi:S-DNA-T family DNA segregation ATPase FtsK/SpoIIIE